MLGRPSPDSQNNLMTELGVGIQLAWGRVWNPRQRVSSVVNHGLSVVLQAVTDVPLWWAYPDGRWGKGVYNSAASAQTCCEPKSAPKNKSLLKKKSSTTQITLDWGFLGRTPQEAVDLACWTEAFKTVRMLRMPAAQMEGEETRQFREDGVAEGRGKQNPPTWHLSLFFLSELPELHGGLHSTCGWANRGSETGSSPQRVVTFKGRHCEHPGPRRRDGATSST